MGGSYFSTFGRAREIDKIWTFGGASFFGGVRCGERGRGIGWAGGGAVRSPKKQICNVGNNWCKMHSEKYA